MPKRRRGPVTRSSSKRPDPELPDQDEEPEKPKRKSRQKKIQESEPKQAEKLAPKAKRSNGASKRCASKSNGAVKVPANKLPEKEVKVEAFEDPMALIMMVEGALAKSSQISETSQSFSTNGYSPYFPCEPSTSRAQETFLENGQDEDDLMSDHKSETSIESSTGDWEEVKGAYSSSDDSEYSGEKDLKDYHPQVAEEGIEIELKSARSKNRGQEKRRNAREAFIRQRANKKKIENQINLHKSHFVALLARGRFINGLTFYDQSIQALSLSYIPFLKDKLDVSNINQRFIQDYLTWFRESFTLESKPVERKPSLKNVSEYPATDELLVHCLESKSAKSCTEFLLTFIAILRSLRTENSKVQVRLCYSMTPSELKPKDLILSDKQKKLRRSDTTPPGSDLNKEKMVKKRTRKDRKMISSEDDEEVHVCDDKKHRKSPKKGDPITIEHWAEVFVVSDGKWLCVEPINQIVDEPFQMETVVASPIIYVISFDDFNHVKDVTCRYTPKFMNSNFQKLRAEKEWLKDTLDKLRPGYQTKQDQDEDMQLETQLTLQPLPKTIGEYKNHPLYALKKHLLQYEAIHPSDAPTIGFFRSEPVYERSCIKNVRSREYWKRQARVVRDDETPYKIIKGRKKWDKWAEKYQTDIPKDLFGLWQTDPYDPPVAKDGKVPRNEFGNVELFQPCMLPIGTVHMRLPGLARIRNQTQDRLRSGSYWFR